MTNVPTAANRQRDDQTRPRDNNFGGSDASIAMPTTVYHSFFSSGTAT